MHYIFKYYLYRIANKNWFGVTIKNITIKLDDFLKDPTHAIDLVQDGNRIQIVDDEGRIAADICLPSLIPDL